MELTKKEQMSRKLEVWDKKSVWTYVWILPNKCQWGAVMGLQGKGQVEQLHLIRHFHP